MTPWNILGINPTNDIREIKKAYAEKSKEYHPEEYPEEFRRLHEAYQAAVKLARAGAASGRTRTAEEAPKAAAAERPEGQTDCEYDFSQVFSAGAEKEAENKAENYDFSQLNSAAAEKPAEIPEQSDEIDFEKALLESDVEHNKKVIMASRSVIDSICALFRGNKNPKEKAICAVLRSKEAEALKEEQYFVNKLCTVLSGHMNSENFVVQVFEWLELYEYENEQRGGLYAEIYDISAQPYYSIKEKRRKKKAYRGMVSIAVVVSVSQGFLKYAKHFSNDTSFIIFVFAFVAVLWLFVLIMKKHRVIPKKDKKGVRKRR